MILSRRTAALLASVALTAGVSPALALTPAPKAAAVAPATNPLLAEWTGPYGGVPPFDQVKVSDFEPAIDAAIADQLAKIDAIAKNPAPATFENTIIPLERSGAMLNRVGTITGIWFSNLASPEVQAVQAKIAPKYAALGNAINQNAALFQRIETVWKNADKAGLNAEQKRVVELAYNDLVRSGAKLSPETKARVAAINTELAGLFNTFSKNLLADEGTWIVLEGEADLAGLPSDLRAAAASLAKARGLEGKFIVANTRSSVDPFLAASTNRALREKVWRAFVNRGDNGDANDNNAVIAKILKLRAERAKLLGYKTHAHWRVENQMAKTPEAAMDLMLKVWGPAVERVKEEVADMQAVADAEAKAGKGPKITIEPWDYRFYAEKVRKAKYDLDQNEVKQYLQLDKMVEGMFWAANTIYGYDFKKVTDVPVFHPDVSVYRVDRNGQFVGLFYFDPYGRPGKRSGAWMNSYRAQQKMDGDIKTIVSNNSNFVKTTSGEPVLISWDDTRTLFHEFGHALNGLASNVTYPSVSGTANARDFVEFPSQINEHWFPTPELLSKFALHYKTGAPLPASLLAKIENAGKFNQGFATVEATASALIDMKLHLAGDTPIDPDAFERETLTALNMPKELVMRHRTPQFGHVFSSDGYSAGYYGYLWSDSLTADAWEAFEEGQGAYDKAVAKRFEDTILAVGDSVDPAQAFRNFRGRDVNPEALMRKRGFVSKKK